MFIAYSYDEITGEYIETVPADLDELETELRGIPIYLLPRHSTDIVPLKEKEGYSVCFDTTTNSWNYKEDHRGQIVYRKEDLAPVSITELGPIPPIYFTTLPKPDNIYQYWSGGEFVYPELESLKLTIKNKLDGLYADKLEEVYKFGNYYVQPSWATIYTNTLVAMQQDISEDGKLDQTYYVLLITNPAKGKLYHMKVTSIDQFLPFYNKVKELYKKLTEQYHDRIIAISNATDAETLLNIINNY